MKSYKNNDSADLYQALEDVLKTVDDDSVHIVNYSLNNGIVECSIINMPQN